MTDREMLELAAKAAGIALEHEEATGRYLYRKSPYDLAHNGRSLKAYWNPLTDDGDALRLAVRLGLCVQVLNQYGETQVFRKAGYTLEKHGTDPDAATRRAIVRAAAEIGKNMK